MRRTPDGNHGICVTQLTHVSGMPIVIQKLLGVFPVRDTPPTARSNERNSVLHHLRVFRARLPGATAGPGRRPSSTLDFQLLPPGNCLREPMEGSRVTSFDALL